MEKILELIQHHKTAKEEVSWLLNELSQISQQKITKEEKDSLERTILVSEIELSMRLIFISDLENLLQ